MGEVCRFDGSRACGSGEVIRKCRLDLAPDAPWRCPDDCPKFSRRTYAAGWTVAPPAARPTPTAPEVGDAAAELLGAAEDIINSIGPEILESVRRQRGAKRNPVARGAD